MNNGERGIYTIVHVSVKVCSEEDLSMNLVAHQRKE
jgi:hypothetical protein